MKTLERKAYTAFGKTGFGKMGFGKTGFGEMGRHCFTFCGTNSLFSSSTSFWYQFLHFLLNYSFTHHFFLF